MKKSAEHEHAENCSLFSLELIIAYNHNHSIESANAFKCHNVNEEKKAKFIELLEMIILHQVLIRNTRIC